jgi:transketolase N-terminal domain/subunit
MNIYSPLPCKTLKEKFKAFGYVVRHVDRNDVSALANLFDSLPFEAEIVSESFSKIRDRRR